jgi:exodeoxyribonuclease VII small subunit
MTKKADYQSLSTELDDVIGRLQNDDISVDEAVKCYERGMALVKELQLYLKDGENKVQKIKTDFDALSK